MPVVNSKFDTELVGDYDATVEFVRASFKGDLKRMAIAGFCRGGRTALVYTAANPRLKAAVSWYGPVGGQPNAFTPRTAMDRADEIRVPCSASTERRTPASRWIRSRSSSPR